MSNNFKEIYVGNSSDFEMDELLGMSDSHEDDVTMSMKDVFSFSDSEVKENLFYDETQENEYIYKRQKFNSISTEETYTNSNLFDPLESEVSSTFNWTKNNFKPILHEFNQEFSGIKANFTPNSTPLDAFQLFFSENLVSNIVRETNNYYKYVIANSSNKIKSRINSWKDTDISEMYAFFALTMLMPRVKKLAINEYWSTDELLQTNTFRKTMVRDRYLLLMQMLHFNDNNIHCEDPLIKIRPIVDDLKKSFAESFYPGKKLCIDESLMLFKGRVYFKQYIPSKRSRFGIKSFVLCDCKTNYVLNYIIYTGSKTECDSTFSNVGKSGDVVMSLIKPYLDKGHTLITDNWYSSPNLFDLLHKMKTNAFGTVRKNRKDMPIMDEKLEKGLFDYKNTDNLLALRWRDKKDVYMLTSAHEPKMIVTTKTNYATGLNKSKPACVVDYNLNMGSVDMVDMVLSAINSCRKSLKWYKKYFFHLLDMSIYNSYILYQQVTNKKLKYSKFHLILIKQILQKYPQENKRQARGRPRLAENLPSRLTERHFPSKILNQEGKVARRICVVCKRKEKRKDTSYQCNICDVGLCVDPCFEIHHTQINY
jgi:hypothetical protein